MKYFISNGDCLEKLKCLEDESVDSLVTDPPAGISFMGKDWDDDKGGRDQWVAWMTSVMSECLRVLKPGAHGLVWALPRTSHWTATALEDAGFEVRDVVTHLFGTGFPKSMDISKAIDKAAGAEREIIGEGQAFGKGSLRNKSRVEQGYRPTELNPEGGSTQITAPSTEAAKQWAGWGTALKPASEHWILVRKPLEAKHTVAANILKHGVGGINIDASRVETSDNLNGDAYCKGEERMRDNYSNTDSDAGASMFQFRKGIGEYVQPQGRFPANLILDEEAAKALDEQSGVLKTNPGKAKTAHKAGLFGVGTQVGRVLSEDSEGGVSRFFYVAKASKSDKGENNTHPTVKSRALMSYLIKLVTPPGGVVLDPFMGSGSTGVAALSNDFLFVGIEKENTYYVIAEGRIMSALKQEKIA
jgi:hypothetical protein